MIKRTCEACGKDRPDFAFGFNTRGAAHTVCSPCRRAQSLSVTVAARGRDGAAAAAKADARAARAAVAAATLATSRAVLRDDLFAAMHLGRSRRALDVVKRTRQGMHRIKLNDERGFVSIAEIAARHAEREACSRAFRRCDTYDDAVSAIRILERAAPSAERAQTMRLAWRDEPLPRTGSALQRIVGEPEAARDDAEPDAFEDAFGDWAPAWMQRESLAA